MEQDILNKKNMTPRREALADLLGEAGRAPRVARVRFVNTDPAADSKKSYHYNIPATPPWYRLDVGGYALVRAPHGELVAVRIAEILPSGEHTLATEWIVAPIYSDPVRRYLMAEKQALQAAVNRAQARRELSTKRADLQDAQRELRVARERSNSLFARLGRMIVEGYDPASNRASTVKAQAHKDFSHALTLAETCDRLTLEIEEMEAKL